MTETSLDLARRLVREGLEQIDRQTKLIVKLDASGDERSSPDARRVLATMLTTQSVLEADLIRLESDDSSTDVPCQREAAE